jgi:ABC-type spermidine/putrescine transport system permease subunit I
MRLSVLTPQSTTLKAGIEHERRRLWPAGEGNLEQFLAWALTGLWGVGVLLPVLSLLPISLTQGKGFELRWSASSLGAYSDILVGYRLETILRTLRIVLTVTTIELIFAFPFALWLAKGIRNGWVKRTILVLLVVPFFLSPAARTIVWQPILGRVGILNSLAMAMGIVDRPIDWLLFSSFSIHLGLVGPNFPSMVWPLFISLSLVDNDLLHASRDLGAGAAQTLRFVVLPLAFPGVVAGFVFTAVPMLGDNVVPELLGGGQVSLVAESSNNMIGAMNYPGAAALASVMVLGIVGAGALTLLAVRGATGFRNQP